MKGLIIRGDLKAEFESTIEERIDRYLEISHQFIIGNHHFAEASSECIKLYRDGYFISAVMVSQALNGGIIRFIAERNCIDLHPNNDKGKTKKISTLIDEFEEKNIISAICAEASRGISKSFRNDVHHMNPKVAQIDFKELAKSNLQHLSTIEKEIFGVDIGANGAFILKQPKYWNCNNDGKVSGYLRIGG